MPGLTAMPSRPAMRFMTTPVAGAATVSVRRTSPVALDLRRPASGAMSQ